MSCPDTGALRAALDGERPDLTAHVDSCARCEGRVHDLSDTALVVATALDGQTPQVDVRAALAKVRPARPAEVVTLAARAPRRPSLVLRNAAAALVVLVLVSGFLATPGGRATATSLLERFRAERLAVVPVNLASLDPAALDALVEVAEIRGLEDVEEPRPVADLDEAAAVAGFRVEPLDVSALPADLAGPVTVLAQPPQTVRIDFADDPEVPSALRQAVLVLDVPGVVLQAVGGEQGLPAAVRGEAGQLGVTVEGGPTLAEVREALLSLPGLPPDTVAALRGIEDWETTLPLPVPAGSISWEETTVAGQPAFAFGDESVLGSALVWRDGERFIGVGGLLPLSQTRRLAEGP
jgi:hypothetical protein